MQLFIETEANKRYPLLPEPILPSDLITEDQTYRLSLVHPAEEKDLAGCHLLLGDLDHDAGRYERVDRVSWRWDVQDYAGRVTVGVERDGIELLPTRELIVDPNLNKLTRDQFASMVNDISAEAAIAYSLSPATSQVELGRRRQAFNLAQLEYIRQQIDPLRRAVEAIARQPRRALKAEDEIVDLAHACAPDDGSVVWLLGRPAELLRVDQEAVPAGARGLHRSMRGHLPRRLKVGRRHITYDIYENQLLKHFLQHLNSVLRHTQQRLAEVATANDWRLDERTIRLARRRLNEVRVYRCVLHSLLELDFLQEVGPLRQQRPVTPALRKAPHYARFYALYRQFDRAITPFDGAPFRLSLEKTWQLYEYWCFFQVVAALRRLLGGDLQFDARSMLGEHADRISLALHQATISLNPRVQIHFQKSYNYYGHTRAGTYSHQMRPDIGIEFLDDKGGIERIVLLDPKYRVSGQSLNQAMDELHCYKDAIVDPKQQRLVHTALALCPSSEKAKGLYFRPDYIRCHGLGALVLQPGDSQAVESLATHLAQFVIEEANA